MKKVVLVRFFNFVMFTVMLPFMSVCTGGGSGSASLLGSLFGASSGGSALGSGLGGGTTLASIHHPEPTTFVLVGSGIMTMAYLRNRKTKK